MSQRKIVAASVEKRPRVWMLTYLFMRSLTVQEVCDLGQIEILVGGDENNVYSLETRRID